MNHAVTPAELRAEMEKRQAILGTLAVALRNLSNALRALYFDAPQETDHERSLLSAHNLTTWLTSFSELAESQATADLADFALRQANSGSGITGSAETIH